MAYTMKQGYTLLIGTLILFCFTCLAPLCMAGDGEITARYSQPRGTNIKWSITIPNPPPVAVIVIQMIPPWNRYSLGVPGLFFF